MTEEDEPKRIDLFCPRCNMLVEAKVRATARGPVTEEVAALTGPEDSVYSVVRYEIALCGRCNGPFLVETRSYEVPGEFCNDDRERVLYPSERKTTFEGVPDPIARSYEQAARSFQAGLYEPCAIMCRKCLEGFCGELKASGRTLRERLSALERAGTIDSKLFGWADQLRIVGNDAAHDLAIVMDRDDARDALEFVEAILMYAFTLNRRFQAFRRRREAARRSDEERAG